MRLIICPKMAIKITYTFLSATALTESIPIAGLLLLYGFLSYGLSLDNLKLQRFCDYLGMALPHSLVNKNLSVVLKIFLGLTLLDHKQYH